MQISFAILITVIGSLMIFNASNDDAQSVQDRTSFRVSYKKIELMRSVASRVRLAYDLAQQNGTGCPTGAAVLPGLINSSKLCWSGLTNGCFSGVTFDGKTVCLANTQTFTLDKLFGVPKAYAAPFPNVRTYVKGTYDASTAGVVAPVLYTGGGVSPAKGGANVRLPTADVGNSVNSNYINCGRTHTDCLTLTFCTNGSRACLGRNRITQTFAFRHF